ncbi:MAG: hypothetical protein IJU76_15290, partial [Desulfovibrionaceae bacterium]|nr:hypothetical protein [Desulfovibrionaceae bacterium]
PLYKPHFYNNIKSKIRDGKWQSVRKHGGSLPDGSRVCERRASCGSLRTPQHFLNPDYTSGNPST